MAPYKTSEKEQLAKSNAFLVVVSRSPAEITRSLSNYTEAAALKKFQATILAAPDRQEVNKLVFKRYSLTTYATKFVWFSLCRSPPIVQIARFGKKKYHKENQERNGTVKNVVDGILK